MYEDAAVLKLIFSPDGYRLISIGKTGIVKIFKSIIEDAGAGKAYGGLPPNVDASTDLWEEEQEVRGHPLGCWSAAMEPKAAFFVVVGRDNIIRVFGEGVPHGPINDDIAPLAGTVFMYQ
jgi:hypothetical protein